MWFFVCMIRKQKKAMNERNLNEGQWEDRKQWSLGVRQHRKTFSNWCILIIIYDQETKSGFTPAVCFHIVYYFQWACLALSLALLLIYSHHCIWSCKDLTGEPSKYLSLYFIDVFLKWDNFWAQGNGVSLIKDSYNLLLIWHTHIN
jgi:hypothetical protein